jgi:hypothetical protein
MKSVAREAKPFVATDGGWSGAARENSDRMIQGQLLRFIDGRWLSGKELTPIAEGARFTALGTVALWLFWENGKPDEGKTIVRQLGEDLPEREALGDTDKSLWERGLDGAPRDPWSDTRLVYLVSPETAEAFTFTTKSKGGHVAVAELGDQIERKRDAYPGATPIVELGSASWSIKYMKPRPKFLVVGWQVGPAGGEAGAQPAPVRRLAQNSNKDLDGDGIPY